MKLLWVLLISSTILFLHEIGHVIAAKLMKMPIRKFSFSMRPFPRFYVSVVDRNISLIKRIIYFLSGNFMTILLFAICVNFQTAQTDLILYIIAIQILVETNPFLSDYSSLLFYIKNRKAIDGIPVYIYNKRQEEQINLLMSNLKDSYFLSRIWCVHFVLWFFLIILILTLVAKPF